jgi:signal peptidase I
LANKSFILYWFIDIIKGNDYTWASMIKEARAARDKPAAGKAVIGAFAAALVMKFFIFDFMIAEGHSMVPAIKPGAILLVCKVFYGFRLPGSGTYLFRWQAPREGDIVVFYTPLGEIAVKRCGATLLGNAFYALGDNAPQSYDSRSYGPVPDDNIIGRVLGIK